jgi:mRNA-degrading endonuclease YafQ of YafQ-DinJ toxin-antitoxin module
MVEVAYSKSFKKAFSKRIKGLQPEEKRFYQRLKVFLANPHHPSLKTHKLSGELKDLWSFSIDFDLRVVFYFSTASKVVFIDIGSHDEVY